MTGPGASAAGLELRSALADAAPSLLDALDTAITVWDGRLRCVYVNAAAVQMLERPASELIGRSLLATIGEERFRAYEPERAVVMSGRAVEFEWQVQRSEGLRTRRLRLLPRRLADGRIDGFIVVTDDVTEARAMRQAVDELAASEAKFRALADSLPVGVYHSDARARNTYTNARWREIAGLDVEHSLGDRWRDILHPEDRDAVDAELQRVVGTGGEFEMALRLCRPDGTVRQVIGRTRPLRGPDGELTGYVGTNEDVTERLAAERQLRESQALLDRVGRLANVGGWEILLPQWELRWNDQTRRILERPEGYRPALGDSRVL